MEIMAPPLIQLERILSAGFTMRWLSGYWCSDTFDDSELAQHLRTLNTTAFGV
jgi:hypothetical protein